MLIAWTLHFLTAYSSDIAFQFTNLLSVWFKTSTNGGDWNGAAKDVDIIIQSTVGSVQSHCAIKQSPKTSIFLTFSLFDRSQLCFFGLISGFSRQQWDQDSPADSNNPADETINFNSSSESTKCPSFYSSLNLFSKQILSMFKTLLLPWLDWQ